MLITLHCTLSRCSTLRSEVVVVEPNGFVAEVKASAIGRPPTTLAKPKRAMPKYLDPNGYCSTHGYRVSKGHNSATCTNKSDGHKDTATRANTMNGSAINKGWELKFAST